MDLGPRRYRVQIEAEGYRPFYRMTLEGRRFNGPPFYRETAMGIEFDAFPYNDMTPPQFTINESFEITERSLEELRKKLEEEKVPVEVAKIRTALSTESDTAELDDVTILEKDDIVSINSVEYTIQSVTKDDSANSGKGKITVTPILPAGTAANTDVKKKLSTKDVDQLLKMLEQLKNQEVMGEESFLDLLRRTIGDKQMVLSFIVETAFVAQPGTVLLAPAVNYPFPTHVPVLRGVVVDQQSRKPIVDAEVSWKNKEQVLADERGEFGLPLRLTEENEKTDPQNIDATDHRTGRTGTIIIQLPQALRSSQRITIS